MNKKRRGIALISMFAILTLIMGTAILLVTQMQSGVFLGTKVNNSLKAYWAANAGVAYAKARLTETPLWPYEGELKTGMQIGDYTVTEENTGSGYLITGVNEKENAAFYIAFPPGVSGKNAVPSSRGSFKDQLGNHLDFFSVNNCREKLEDDNGEDIRVSDRANHTVKMIHNGVYIASDGRYNAQRSVVETSFYIDGGGKGFSSAMFAAKNMDLDFSGSGAGLTVNHIEGKGLSIVCEGNLYATQSLYSDPTTIARMGNKNALNIENGVVYCAGECSINRVSVTEKNAYTDYGFSLVKQSMIENFPEIGWSEVAPAANEYGHDSIIPAGTYLLLDTYRTAGGEWAEFNRLYTGPGSDAESISTSGRENRLDELETSIYREQHREHPNREKIEGWEGDIDYYNTNFITKPQATGSKDLYFFPRKVQPGDLSMENYLKDFSNVGAKRLTVNGQPNPALGDEYDFSAIQVDWNANIIKLSRPVKVDKYSGSGSSDNTLRLGIIDAPNAYRDESDYSSPHIYQASPLSPTLELTGDMPDDVSFMSSSTAERRSKPSLYTESAINLEGMVSGVGEIVSSEKISIECGSALQGFNIALYSKKDVEITYTPDTGKNRLQQSPNLALRDALVNNPAILTKITNKQMTLSQAREAALNTPLSQGFLDEHQDIQKLYVYMKEQAENGGGVSVTLREFLECIHYDNETKIRYVEESLANNIQKDGSITLANWHASPVKGSYIKGIVYTWGDFIANSNGGDFYFQGLIVARGNSGTGGNIRLKNNTNFNLTYDASQLDLISGRKPEAEVTVVFFNRLI